MGSNLEALIAKSSSGLGPQLAEGEVRRVLGEAYALLDDLLTARNGFYAFHRALHVFPLFGNAGEIGLVDWNAPTLWRNDYPDMAPSGFFFAEDLLGAQFWTNGDAVCLMDEESGVLSVYAKTFEDWARRLLADDGAEIGANLAHEWQEKNGLLMDGFRIAPKVPFILKGSPDIGNLYAARSVDLMKFRADIATQVKDLPDGTRVEVKVI